MTLNFEIGVGLQLGISLVNKVLEKLEQPELFENPDFVCDMVSAGFGQLICKLEPRRTNAIRIVFFFYNDGLRIDIDGIDETFEWTSQEVESDPERRIFPFLCDLLSSFILVERSNRGIVVQFFGLDGIMVENVTVRTFGFFGRVDPKSVKAHLFFPCYPVDAGKLQ